MKRLNVIDLTRKDKEVHVKWPLPAPKAAYSIIEAAHALSIGRSSIYKLLDAKILPSVMLGSRRLIPAQAIEDLLSRLAAEDK